MHHTAVALVKEGYVVLCPDSLCFEERQDPTGKLKDGDYERFEFLREVVRGRCLAWRDVFDMKQSISMLLERPEVDKDRIGCYGHSMGSTHAWLAGPLEPRIKCVIGNCCLPTYEAIEQNHILHCFPNFVPGWKKYGDTPDIASLIAPRALHLNFGEKDDGSPIESVKQGLKRIAEVYQKKGVPENFTVFHRTRGRSYPFRTHVAAGESVFCPASSGRVRMVEATSDFHNCYLFGVCISSLSLNNFIRCHSVENEPRYIIIIIRNEFEITPVFPYKKLVFGGKKNIKVNITKYVYQ